MSSTVLTKFCFPSCVSSAKCWPPPPSEIITFLPWLCFCLMSSLNCSGVTFPRTWYCIVPSGAPRNGVANATIITSHWGDTSLIRPNPDQYPISWCPLGPPVSAIGGTVTGGASLTVPKFPSWICTGHGLDGPLSAFASGKLYAPDAEPAYHESNATFCK